MTVQAFHDTSRRAYSTGGLQKTSSTYSQESQDSERLGLKPLPALCLASQPPAPGGMVSVVRIWKLRNLASGEEAIKVTNPV